jgi:acetyltransferase-like isoleucine patch superfamily enzyme
MNTKSNIKKIARKTGITALYYKFKTVFSYLKTVFLAFKFYFYNSFITNFPSYKVRTVYLRKVLRIKIGNQTSIHMGCFFAGSNIIIGNNTVIARKCYLDGRVGVIEIKNNVSIAPETSIISMSHIIDSPTFDCVIKPVLIEDYVWIGARVMILPGVTLDKGSVVGAASVVTKSVAAYNIVAGSPAKKIREKNRNEDLQYQLNYFPFFNSDIT